MALPIKVEKAKNLRVEKVKAATKLQGLVRQRSVRRELAAVKERQTKEANLLKELAGIPVFPISHHSVATVAHHFRVQHLS